MYMYIITILQLYNKTVYLSVELIIVFLFRYLHRRKTVRKTNTTVK